MAETIYLSEIALEYCGEDYEREIRKLFHDDSLKEKLQEIKESIDDMYDLASDIKDSISDI